MALARGKSGLSRALKRALEGAKRVAVLGIGNELRGDDAAGLLFARSFRRYAGERILVLECGVAPENFTDEIGSFDPTHIVVVDAVEMSHQPGSLGLFDEDSLPRTSISTHKLSLSLLKAYLMESGINASFLLLGIQPRDIGFCAPISPEVRHAAELAVEALAEALNMLIRSNQPTSRGEGGGPPFSRER